MTKMVRMRRGKTRINEMLFHQMLKTKKSQDMVSFRVFFNPPLQERFREVNIGLSRKLHATTLGFLSY